MEHDRDGGEALMNHDRKNSTTAIAVIGSMMLAIMLVVGTMWTGARSRRDTEEAVCSVSLLYLDELAGRREQVVENNLREKIQTIRVAIDLMTDEDLSDKAHLEAYQTRMKQLYHLDKFAFVDTDGLIYTSTGTQSDIEEYSFDYHTLAEPEISIYHPESADKRVIIAVPASIPFMGKTLSVCFMAIDMQEMLSGVSLTTNTGNATFCNIYTESGSALTDSVLGGLAMEDNLLDAMRIAVFEPPYSYESFAREFQAGTRGVVSFTFNGIRETLTYIPVSGTDWLLTYLIRESVISERISSISDGTVRRSILQSALTIAAMLIMFGFIIAQTKRNSRLLLERETVEAENRVKQEELEQRLALQEKLLEQQETLHDALTAAEEASKAKSAFLSNMSHEMRTPMNAIIGLDSIALNDPDLTPKTREYLEKIGESAGHLLELINDILDMSQIESGGLTLRNEEFSFRKLLEAVNTMFAGRCREKGLEYRCSVSSETDESYVGDGAKLRQVLINILDNAVKFTPSGGRVELQVERTARFDGKSTLRFTVSDTGIGMSEDYLPHLFDTFSQEDSSTTTKYGSTGLGMPITKSMVELMHGRIEVESEKGVGSTFVVTVTLSDSDGTAAQEEACLPGETAAPTADGDPASSGPEQPGAEKPGLVSERKDIPAGTNQGKADLSGRRLLLAEDVDVNAEIIHMILQMREMRAERAENGKKAVELFTAHPEGYYDAILMDLRMPEMDGLEATRVIRATDRPDAKTIPIIALTANAFDEDVQRSLQAGLNAHLSKPVQPEILYETLESLIR